MKNIFNGDKALDTAANTLLGMSMCHIQVPVGVPAALPLPASCQHALQESLGDGFSSLIPFTP